MENCPNRFKYYENEVILFETKCKSIVLLVAVEKEEIKKMMLYLKAANLVQYLTARFCRESLKNNACLLQGRAVTRRICAGNIFLLVAR